MEDNWSAIVHYKLKFKGYEDFVLRFDVHKGYDPNEGTVSDWDEHFEIKEDGYFYIEGRKITNNPQGIQTLRSSFFSGNYEFSDSNEAYVDNTYSIDSSGYIIVDYHHAAPNKVDRFLNRLFG